MAHAVTKASPAVIANTGGSATPAVVTSTSTTTTTTIVSPDTPAPAPTRPARPAQKGNVHDHALTGMHTSARSLLSARRKALASALEHLTAERHHGTQS